MRLASCLLLAAAALSASAASAADLCAGKKPGTITFYNAEISRDAPLPPEASELAYGKDMFALLCLTDAVGPQPEKGTKFRVVMYVDGKQFGIYRPQLSKPRKDIIISVKEDFGDRMSYMLDAGKTYRIRLQGATEKGTGNLDVTFDFRNDVAYVQELRKAGYVADGQIMMKR